MLIEIIQAGDMPPKDEPPLSKVQMDVIRRWIAAGASIAGPEELPLKDADDVVQAARQHWAFQPVKKGTVPSVKATAWLRTPVDAFILAELERRKWRPAAPAPRGVWIRRVYFDLIGLPPSPEDVASFLNDELPGAHERVVERLLASPAYGERWAQHWLDVVRFAETEGFEYDRHLPDAWRFRDYVIDSLNRDKPFDQFLTEQVAGDEIGPNDRECQTAAIFHRLGPVRRNAGNPDIALSRNEVLTERTNIVGTAFLGLTVGCARCHNHKLEPITQKDYYRLQAYFAAAQEENVSLATAAEEKQWKAKTDRLTKQIKQLQKRAEEVSEVEADRLRSEIQLLESQLPAPLATIPTVRNNAELRTAIHVLRRGVWEQKGTLVGPRPPSVLVSSELDELPASSSQPRTQLARWLVGLENPLTARVLVNRIWQQHFGLGLVQTANDFGTHGDPPSHPELLDWLAATLVEDDWQLKTLHRAIVLSNAYRQSSTVQRAAAFSQVDPQNRLLWKFNRRRLSAEELRDAMLVASGRLNPTMGGPSIMVPVDRELVNLLYKPSQWKVAENQTEHHRRSVYLIAKRNLRLPFMDAFDAPALQTSCSRRETSTHAPQALELLNGRLANALSRDLAERLTRECGDRREQIVARAFVLVLGREPTKTERQLSIEFLREQPINEFALGLFNLNDFAYVR